MRIIMRVSTSRGRRISRRRVLLNGVMAARGVRMRIEGSRTRV